MGENFTNVHRYFIQFMLHNGCVKFNNALIFFEEISPEEHSSINLKNLVITINRTISKQSYKIMLTTCEVTGEEVLVWINIKNDELSKLQTGFTAVELEYFHAIITEILTSEHKIVYPRAINISSTLTATLSRENGEKALLKWINGGYFVKNSEFIYLGPRTILEFTSYLRTNSENSNCELCSELVFVGSACESCNKTFHSHCLEKYLQNQETCPSCKNEWKELIQQSQDMDTD